MTDDEKAAIINQLVDAGFDSESITMILDDLAAAEDWRDEQADRLATMRGVG